MTSLREFFQAYFRYHNTKVGDIISARVISISNSAVTLRAGLKSDAIAPLSEFRGSGGKILVQLNDLVPVYVVDDGSAKGTAQLSYEKAKKLTIWRTLERCLRTKACVNGRIINRVKGGMTAIISGMKAFLPGSLIDIKPTKNAEMLIGKKQRFHVIKLDSTRSNIVISRRSVLEQERLENRGRLLSTLKDGMVVKGTVKNITDYGAFIDLGGLDGLLHITDMSWKRIKHPSNVLSLGDTTAVKVLKYDRSKPRVSLGLKQLHTDPWDEVISRYPPGRRVKGRVTNITDYGAFVEIEPGIEGLVHISEMHWKNKTALPQRLLRIGQTVHVTVIDISKTRRRISLGMRQPTHNSWSAFAKVFRKTDRLVVTIRSLARLGVFVSLPMNLRGLLYLPRTLRRSVSQLHAKSDVVEASVVNVNVSRRHVSLISDGILSTRFYHFARTNSTSPCSLTKSLLPATTTKSGFSPQKRLLLQPKGQSLLISCKRTKRTISSIPIDVSSICRTIKALRLCRPRTLT